MRIVHFLFFLLLMEGISSVQITNFRIPEQAIRGEDLTLVCEYELGSNKLYSVTWTRGTHDFYTYKYLPSGRPTKGVFQLPGITVDEKLSTDSKVVIKNLQLSATGLIECAVTAEHTFMTDSRKQFLAVLDIPSDPPNIHPIYPIQNYKTGGKISLSCETPPSSPASNITWYINGKKASRQLLTHNPVRKLHTESGTLEVSSSSLNFVIQEGDFQDGQVIIACEARIGSSYKRTTKYSAYKDGYSQMIVSAAERYLPLNNWLFFKMSAATVCSSFCLLLRQLTY
ncbi:uncharacterized protein LOC136039355 [Artemia franciscana]|uniref:uncharacterized protein LOC136039355 n=1 Tax=Artemia franciscana TaxID=6661 RepID=UPI0032DBA8BB